MATISIYADEVGSTLISNDPTYNGARTAGSADSVKALNLVCDVGQAKEGDNGFFVYRTALIFTIPVYILAISAGKLTLFEDGSAIADAQYMYLLDPEGDIAESGVVVADFGQLLGNTTEWGKIHKDAWIGGPGNRNIDLNSLALATIAAGQKFIVAMRSGNDINNVADVGFIERNRFMFSGVQDSSAPERPRLQLTYVHPSKSQAYSSG